MKTVLVTGARGFIGRHTLASLKQRGYDIVAVSSRSVRREEDDIRWRTADLLDHGQVQRLLAETCPTHLLHLAWYAKPGAFWNAPANLQWLEAGQALIRGFQQAGGERVVVAGTCAEYAEISGVYDEQETPLAPRTIYGKGKHLLQQYVECFRELTGISAAWGRVFFVYGADGPAEKFPQSVVASLSNGQPALCSHGRQLRDYSDARDIAGALVALLDSSVQGAVNIGSGEGSRIREMAEQLAARCGRLDLLKLGALPARENEPAVMVADITRLREEVGWSPRIPCVQGLDELANYWLESVRHEDAA